MNYPRFKAAVRTTIVNSTVNTLLALLKIVFGVIGHSQALVADGIHSFSDLITDAMVLITAKMGEQHPDQEHPYGHRRIETIGSIIISLILIIVAASIVYEAMSDIMHPESASRPTWITAVVAAISIVANEFLYRYTLHYGNKVNSDLLRSNAWHNRSDALTSVIVLVAVIGAILGVPYLDAIGAFVIALLIFKMGIKLIWGNIQELIDASVDEKTLSEIKHCIQQTPGVISIHMLRTRLHGGNIFVDVHIQVNPAISVSEGHFIGEQVHMRLKNELSNVTDVTVHIDPEDDETNFPSIHLPTREVVETILNKAWLDLPYHKEIKKISLHYLAGKITAEVVFPISILDHYPKTALEEQIKSRVKHLNYINKVVVLYI